MQNMSEPSPNALRAIKALDKFLEGNQVMMRLFA